MKNKNTGITIICIICSILAVVIFIFLCILLCGKLFYSNNNKKPTQQSEQEWQKELNESLLKESERISEENSYKTYSYEDLIRKPKDYKGKKIAVTGTVVSVQEEHDKMMIQVATDDDYSHIFMIAAYSDDSDERVWENDDITVYGIYRGVLQFTSTIGTQASFPSIKTDSIDIITKAEDKEESTESTESSIDIIIR